MTRRNTVAPAIHALAVLGLTTSAVLAQQVPAPEPTPFGQIRRGSLSLTPDVRLVDLGIDSNVFNDANDRRADFTTTLQPQLDARVKTRSFDLLVSGRAGLVYYQKYTRERAVNPGVIVEAERRLNSRFALFGRASDAYTKDRAGFEIDSRPRRRTWEGTLGVRLAKQRFTVDLQATKSHVAFDAGESFLGTSLSESLNRDTTGGTASVAYRLTPFTSAMAGGEVSTDRFVLSPVRDMDTRRGFVGLRLARRALVQGEVQVGVRTARSRSGLAPSFTGPVWRGGLTYSWFDTLSVGVGGRRDLDFSFRSDHPYFVYDEVEASVRQALFRRFDIGVGASRLVLRYRTFVPSDALSATDVRRGVVRNVAVNVGVRLKGRSRIGVYAAFWDRADGEQPYVSRRLGIEMTLGHVRVNDRGIFLIGPRR